MRRIEFGRLLLILFWIVCLFPNCRSVSLTQKELLLGVAPEDENYYKKLLSSSTTIKCKDGSKKFTISQLNDDFCDCPDASDEPGTSACPNGRFYCKNAGHVPLSLFSSRVNDGICDCCDGSDEYDGKIKCPNTCWEAGKVARDKLKKKIATYKEGVTLRRRDVEHAKLSIAKEEAELAKLKTEEKILKGLVQQLKDHKEQIEKAEEKERLQKEKEEKERKEAEETSKKEQKIGEEAKTSEGEPRNDDFQDKIGLLDDSPSTQDLVEDHGNPEHQVKHGDHLAKEELPNAGAEPAEVYSSQHVEKQEGMLFDDKVGIDAGLAESQEVEATENTDSLSREELGRLVASRWTGEKTEQQTKETSTTKEDNHGEHEEPPKDSYEEEYDRYDSEDNESRYDDDDDDDDNDDDDTEDQMEDFGVDDHDDSSSSYKSESDDEPDLSDTTSSKPSWLEKIQNTVRSIFQAVNLFKIPVDISDAERVRKEYDEASAKLSKLQSRISSLTQKLKHDFGPEKEFYSFYGQCFEGKQNKYVYKICPYKQASQVEGHSTTRLGSWDKFEDSYRIMKFMNGDKCWNGPDRSLKVKLRCGLKNEVTDVDEPSRCEYLALLSTSALCVEEKLKELQDKLDMMNKQQPTDHDEL